MREFRVGEVLSRGFGVFLKNLPSFLLLTVLVASPMILYTIWVVSGELTLPKLERWAQVVGIGNFLCAFIATGAVMYGTVQQLRGERPRIGASLAIGFRRLLPILGVFILLLLCMIGVFVGSLIPIAILSAFIGNAAGFLVLVTICWLMCTLYVSVPVVVIERVGLMGSLGRSRDLTAGHRFGIFAIQVVYMLLWFGANYALRELFMNMVAKADEPVVVAKVYLLVVEGVNILFMTLFSVLCAVTYNDLRQAKEGVGTEELASVFA
jgi:hypothetical protein